MEDQPSWLQDNPINTAPSSSGSGPSTSSAKSSSKAPTSPSSTNSENVPYKRLVQTTVFIFNIGFMVMMAATGAIGVMNANGVSDTGVVFVGIYMILFAGILTAFEFAQICPSESFDNMIKRNFGFLYGSIGKSLFILFMGILAFGLSTPRSLAIATGVCVGAWGCIHGLLFMRFPQYFDKKEKYSP